MTKNAADRYHGLYQHWDMVELGWKFNLSNIQGAILRPQIPGLDTRLGRREEISRAYDAIVDATPGICRPVVPSGTRPARHLYTIWVDPERRDTCLAYFGSQGIGTAVNYRAIHQLTWLKENVPVRFELPNAERIGASTISLPLYSSLTDEEVARVCDVIQASAGDVI
jgi:UDP-4-amino-4-deoxy-L-arabinose-oxoglutarate aminotransferase